MKRATLALCLIPLPALAQSDDRSYLTAFLEDNLSGAGRQVVITGFEGALSSQARIAEMTFADDQGIWLTLRDVALDWNRAALLSGNVSVNELSVAELVVSRLPLTDTTAANPEAGSFSLPDLPVSIDIGKLAATRISLGPDVLGQPVEGRFEAAMTLAGGVGDASLLLERLDSGPEGRIALTASYSNDSRVLALDLSAVEGPGGLVAAAIDLPGQPAVALSVAGTGPVDDFTADIALTTDEIPRLSGRVTTTSGPKATGFAVDLSGDLAPLFFPEYAAFFGDRVALTGTGSAHDDGRLELSHLTLDTRALNLTGTLLLDANGAPQRFDLRGKLADETGAPLLLPLTTDLPVRVANADISVSFDKAKDEGWTGQTTVYGLDRDDFRASLLTLKGSGRIVPGQFGATITFAAEGLQPTDAALAQALGSVVTGEAVLFMRKGEDSLSLPRLSLRGEDYRADATGVHIAGLTQGFAVTGALAASLQDISRFDSLAQTPLAGAATARASGRFAPLTGAFDLALSAEGQNLQSGQAMLDGLLRGQTSLSGDLQRDENGLRLSQGSLTGKGLKARAEGILSSTASDLTAQLQLDDLSVIGPGLGGAINVNSRLTGPLQSAGITATATGQRLRSGVAGLDKLLAGESRLSADLSLRGSTVQINRASLANPEITADITGLADGTEQRLTLNAGLRNLGLLAPDFPGPVSVSGTILRNATGADVDIAGKGPGGIDAVITGKITPDRSNLAIRGRAQAALVNAFILPRSASGQLAFDLRLNGPFALSSISGPITLENGRLADPALAFALSGVSMRATLGGSQASITGTLPISTGGRAAVSGTVGLSEPHSAALGIALQGITLRDPDLFETLMNGALSLTGPILTRPMLAGQISLIETEVRVPSTGFGGNAGLPELRHVNEPAAVRATRARAGLLASAGRAARQGSGDLELDVTISAPNRLFIRGRGLDAELGGELRLLGSLSALAPTGAFNLIRGRLEILGKRFDLDEALLQMEGDLVPFLRVVASTENDGIIANVQIEGPADDPTVSFTSFPELPEEEVLAQLLFGQGLQSLSTLQALELASAVATLAGRGGEGVISRLRQGIGVDNLDVKTTSDGGAEVTAGKYIGKNAYTEITVGQDGKSQINLNLDLTDNITLRGSAGADGKTGIGVFIEKDY